jgi:uncharacterized repeat protein (TIGR03803 family)
MTTLQMFRRFTFAPARGRKRGRMNQLSGWKTACAVFLLCAATTIAAPAQTFTTLVNFDFTNGGYPTAWLVQATDGNFYGTSGGAGAYAEGTVFKITPGGMLTTLYNFCAQGDCTDGISPMVGLVQATDGNFYGTTASGGAVGGGTVFKITPNGALTTLYSFCAQSGCTDGANPYAGLVQATDGNFYGTTYNSGANGYGTVFRITPEGKLTTLHSFDGADGEAPVAGLVQATDGNFYGTASSGGAYDQCNFGCGTVFKITPGGALTTLYSFCAQANCADGFYPSGALIQAGDGNLYGTTEFGGNQNASCSYPGTCGTVFKITPGGKLTTLYSFCSQTNCSDGAQPYAGLLQATNGTFYGTTTYGGPKNVGTVFSLSMGLGPFVSLVRSSGKVGQFDGILGQGFTGATSVSFNGTPANFTVKSDTFLTATVPAGATTGPVTVATPSGTLSSNVSFRVMPQILSFSPTSGPVGSSVVITGNSFTGATLVGFGGVPATSFTVNSDTQITATVPTGAQTGNIAVHTPSGNAHGPEFFTVTP